MTDPKPFTAEELDELESQADHGELSIRQQYALIAQARAEIRLREERDSRNAMWDKVDALAADVLGALDAPAARAKRELGEWLAENYQFRKARRQEHGGRFRVELHQGVFNDTIGPWCASEPEAILSALAVAKGDAR